MLAAASPGFEPSVAYGCQDLEPSRVGGGGEERELLDGGVLHLG